MKKNNVILATLSLSLVCGAFAFANMTPASADETPATFQMVEGASIRVANDPGIRFTVELNETLKEKVEAGTATLGFVASYAENFAGKEDDYLNTVSTYMNPVITADKIYQDDQGAYLANIALVGETVSEDLTKDWSAIAYYTEDGVTTYAGEVQTRSIQLVASRLYFDETADANAKWEAAKTVYASLGTEDMPLLVENGEMGEINSYQALVTRENGELKFKMTENVVAEREAEDGVIVNADEFTVSSPEGLIWDGVTAQEGLIWISGDKGATTGFKYSYDSSKKFNGVGNGAAVLEVDLTDKASADNSNVYFNVNSIYSADYYKALYAQGYTHVTIRFMIPNHGAGVQMGSTLYNGIGHLTKKDAAIVNTYEDGSENQYMWFDHGMSQMGKWLEYSVPLRQKGDLADTGEAFVFDGFKTTTQLFRINAPAAGRKMTVYIDNVYMTKSAGTSETIEMANGTELDLTDSAFDMTGAYNPTIISTKNGETITVNNNKVTLDNGIYDFGFRAENRFGIAKTSYVAFAEKQVLWSYLSDSTLQNIYTSALYTNNTSTPSETSTATLEDSGAGWYSAKVTHSAETSYSDLYIKPTQSKAYYEALKTAGYKYVTIPFSFAGGSFKIAPVGGECGNNIHYNNYWIPTDLHKGFMTVEKAEDGTITETGFVTAGPWSNNGTGYTVSFDINLFINNYNADGMKIARLFTVWGNGAVKGIYRFNEIQFTKDGQLVA